MAFTIVVLIFLCVWLTSAQILRKSIVPNDIMRGGEGSVLCDADLAGLPDRVRGIHQMKLSWNRNRFRATFMLNKGLMDVYLRGRWRLKHYASAHRNIWGWIDRDDIRMEIQLTNTNPTDMGEWCCEIMYFHRTDDAEFSKRCQGVMVSDKAIVHPTRVSPEEPVQISCDGDMAGVPYAATELDYLTLVWENKEYDPNTYLLYEITPDLNDTHTYSHLLTPAGKSHWKVYQQGGRIRPKRRIEKSHLKIGINIASSKDHDSGFYCCGATYYDQKDVKRWEHRCQKLTVGTKYEGNINVQFSSNGSGFMCMPDVLMFGLIVFIMNFWSD
ncbi:uncharacterized protein LOC131954610 [Physella acuta]|uniref:uncharacterized protein LOC131954610 n=1 Tax=Physella acuta TaxID=109671 RepID=UPI0027DB5723|nr:uncharacterized protein LOC131954610 [Physella acuta]